MPGERSQRRASTIPNRRSPDSPLHACLLQLHGRVASEEVHHDPDSIRGQSRSWSLNDTDVARESTIEDADAVTFLIALHWVQSIDRRRGSA